MSLRGLFFQGTCWLRIPLYFLHFPSRPFNLSSLKTVLRKEFVKMKVIVHLIENQTSKVNIFITKILRKKYYTYFVDMAVCFNFHKKVSGTLSFRFLE